MSLWQPESPCDAGCIPPPATRLSPIRQAGRLAALAGVLLAGAAALPVLPVLPPARRSALFRTLARGVLGALGVRLAARGRLPRRHALLVANHISWLDVVALLAVAPARLLAKREVRDWPLIGTLATASGTLFLDRRRPRTLPATVADVASALRAGAVVALFPEGTTWCGAPSGGPFRPAMFQAALDAGVPVVPISIRYTGTGPAGDDAATVVPAFLGADTLWASLRRVLAAPALTVSLAASPALHPDTAATRRTLARMAEAAVRTDNPGVALVAPRPVEDFPQTPVAAATPIALHAA
ncbi:lysophospholipid acyltransferase family protein [Rhizomonospora bruguierae]|uniref:lysophospholipid acyltransferase family protein n=1 Tax=Rhizomonospora bruguierae TaxID=1581705 RepID=UPI001BD05BB7|nr:lysophospholipid acyltransferase family protein [Micromonospora sp. NBRC 107566]